MNLKSLRWAVPLLIACFILMAQPVVAQQVEHCGEVRSNETWSAGATHLVCSAGVTVRNSRLTLAPGADVLMDDGANLVIDSGSQLMAQGTDVANIRIRANSRDDAPGSWGQLRFARGALESTMVRTRVQSGGQGNVPMVQSDDTVVLMDFVAFRKALDVPLAFTAAPLGPSLDVPGQATVGACDRVSLTSNGTNVIDVIGDAQVDLTETSTWHNFCAPYRVRDEIAIGGELDPILVLDVGVSVTFGESGTFVAGVAADQPGQLVVNGSAAEPVTLTGESETPGSWTGITLSEYSGLSSFINTRFTYGGRDGQPMLTVKSPDATALLVTFENAAGYPLAITPAAVSSFMSSLFDIEEVVFIDNAHQRVLVLADEAPRISRSATWGDAGAPFEINGTMAVSGVTIPKLTLDPGAELLFRAGAELVIGDDSVGPGEFVTRGTSERPVVLSATDKQPGSWGGLRITDEASLATVDSTVIEYGGAGGSPMVDWGRTTGDLTRVTFRGAAAYPMRIPLSQAADVLLDPEVPEDEDGTDLSNTLEDNGVDRFFVIANRTFSESASEWHDPGAPVEFDGTVTVSSPSRPLLEMHGGLRLLLPQGAEFRLGDGDRGRAALQIAAEDQHGQPVHFGASDPDAGWLGMRVLKNSDVRAYRLQVEGVQENGVAIKVQDASVELTGASIASELRGTGIEAVGAEATVFITSSVVSGSKIGLLSRDNGVLEIHRSVVRGNSEWGFKNESPDLCLVANLVYWGKASGPNDNSDEKDDCLNGKNVSIGGDNVSDDVDWWPYAINTDFDPSPGLGPNPKKAFCPIASVSR